MKLLVLAVGISAWATVAAARAVTTFGEQGVVDIHGLNGYYTLLALC